jgi:hypothetical protein
MENAVSDAKKKIKLNKLLKERRRGLVKYCSLSTDKEMEPTGT